MTSSDKSFAVINDANESLVRSSAPNAPVVTVLGSSVALFPPPPVDGLGSAGGFKVMIRDQAAQGLDPLQAATDKVVKDGNEAPGLVGLGGADANLGAEMEIADGGRERLRQRQQLVPVVPLVPVLPQAVEQHEGLVQRQSADRVGQQQFPLLSRQIAQRGVPAAVRYVGRMCAGLAARPWPRDPAGQLWHACTMLRETGGDGHLAVCVANGLNGLSANILTELRVGWEPLSYTATRGWSAEAMNAEFGALQARGHEVRRACDARTALALLRASPVDQVVIGEFRVVGDVGQVSEHLLARLGDRGGDGDRVHGADSMVAAAPPNARPGRDAESDRRARGHALRRGSLVAGR